MDIHQSKEVKPTMRSEQLKQILLQAYYKGECGLSVDAKEFIEQLAKEMKEHYSS